MPSLTVTCKGSQSPLSSSLTTYFMHFTVPLGTGLLRHPPDVVLGTCAREDVFRARGARSVLDASWDLLVSTGWRLGTVSGRSKGSRVGNTVALALCPSLRSCLTFCGHFVWFWFGNALDLFTRLLVGRMCLALVWHSLCLPGLIIPVPTSHVPLYVFVSA